MYEYNLKLKKDKIIIKKIFTYNIAKLLKFPISDGIEPANLFSPKFLFFFYFT